MRVPIFGIVERRRDVQVFERGKGRTYRDAVLHAVRPVFYQVGFKEEILFGVDAISEITRIGHGDLLIPTLFPHGVFPTSFRRLSAGYWGIAW